MVPMPMPLPWMSQTLNDALSVSVPVTKWMANLPKVSDHPLCKKSQTGEHKNESLNEPGTVEYEEPHRSSESFGKEFVLEARQVGMKPRTLSYSLTQSAESKYNIRNRTGRTCHG
jgi:hypothetical protein